MLIESTECTLGYRNCLRLPRPHKRCRTSKGRVRRVHRRWTYSGPFPKTRDEDVSQAERAKREKMMEAVFTRVILGRWAGGLPQSSFRELRNNPVETSRLIHLVGMNHTTLMAMSHARSDKTLPSLPCRLFFRPAFPAPSQVVCDWECVRNNATPRPPSHEDLPAITFLD